MDASQIQPAIVSMNSSFALFLIVVAVLPATGCSNPKPAWDSAAGTTMQATENDDLLAAIEKNREEMPPKRMQSTGLAGVRGGIVLKVMQAGQHDVLVPLPQATSAQVPVGYYLVATPPDALQACRLIDRGGQAFACLRLSAAHGQEIRLDWAAAVLFGDAPALMEADQTQSYLAATSCVQSDDRSIQQLADKLWPVGGNAVAYAKNIQAFIRDQKPASQPTSLDALGILKSGNNSICTANANLACALLRAKKIPCRSLAVVPPLTMRLEMHRIVEYYDGGWIAFDPSLLQGEIPLKPYQNLVMAVTTLDDEKVAMQPRFGCMVGAPFGQEAELPAGLNFSGNEFYWTVATPLAEFPVTAELLKQARDRWQEFLKSGKHPPGHLKAAAALKAEDLSQALTSE